MMKRFLLTISALALILGLAYFAAPAKAQAAILNVTYPASPTTVTLQSVMESARDSAGWTNFNDLTILRLTVNRTNLSPTDWTYLRQLFDVTDFTQSSLKLEIISSAGTNALTSIGEPTNPAVEPQWTEIVLPSTVRTVGVNAFKNSKGLKTINLGGTNNDVPEFDGCIKLETVTVQGNVTFASNGGVLYKNGTGMLVFYPPAKAGATFTSLSTTREIGDDAFKNNQFVKNIIFLSGVKDIGDAFTGTNVIEHIWFDAAKPPDTFPTTGLDSDVIMHVPKNTKADYVSKSYFAAYSANIIEDNERATAEAKGLLLYGYVGLKPSYLAEMSEAEWKTLYGEKDMTRNDDDIEGVTNPYKGTRPYIDVTQMKFDDTSLPDGFEVKGYSLNNGRAWKAGGIDALNNALQSASGRLDVIITNDMKGNKSAPDAHIIQFFPISPGANGNSRKLKLFYDDTNWYLMEKGETSTATSIESMKNLQIIQASGGKLPKDPVWASIDDTTDPNYNADTTKIADFKKGAKKITYFLRIPAERDGKVVRAAGKPWKVTPATRSKEPNLKVNYKKELLKVKKDFWINGVYYDDKEDLDLSAVIDETAGKATPTTITVRKATNGKKPGSNTQTITIAQRANAPSVTFSVSKGKIKDAKTKLYEFREVGGTDWVKKLPSVSSSGTVEIRLKSTAKVGKTSTSGNAAGVAGILNITWGTYDEDKGKDGITAASTTTPTG
ncbi:MAG: leucine-rich repeat domain-containing protein [Oscillospiraceae bacterium]|nr:leucine-rich repeat domain-containing protein [Oscillospiraceae bacterium]